VAVVDLANCNGCGRCVADCPFNAIDLAPRSDGKPYSHEVVVDADLCTGCNVCMGSCPTATPFRRATALRAGIAVPDQDVAMLATRTRAAASEHPRDSVIVFACEEALHAMRVALSEPAPDRGGGRDSTEGERALVAVPCVGAVPPAFVDFVLSRGLAGRVLLAGCAECDCQYRLGGEWTEARLARRRDPMLRVRVPHDRVGLAWVGHSASAARAALNDLESRAKAATTAGGEQ
jgi:NAD-dependent dihydropyrimidine dehydrogenase PreA subunit/coenzyme F420-reducing hydrogenase delta subunit